MIRPLPGCGPALVVRSLVAGLLAAVNSWVNAGLHNLRPHAAFDKNLYGHAHVI